MKPKFWWRFLPRSAFSQTVMLIGCLLLINQLVSYVTVAVYVLKPSYQQINQLIARQINLLFVDGIDIGREHLTIVDALNAKVRDDGMKVYNHQTGSRGGNRTGHLLRFWSSQMSEYLGGDAEVRVTHGTVLQI